MHIYAHTCIHSHVCMYVYLHVVTCKYTYMYPRRFVYRCVRPDVYMCVRVDMWDAFVVYPCSLSCFDCTCLTPPSSFLCILGLWCLACMVHLIYFFFLLLLFLFCTITPTHRPKSIYSQRRTPGGCTTTRPAILLQVLIFHFNKETSISLGETGAASPPPSPLGDHTSLGFPTSRHAQPSPPFYVMFCHPPLR